MNLTTIVDLVARVHGPNHPDLGRVREAYHRIEKQSPAFHDPAAVRRDLNEIRVLSNNFQTPADGCDAYRMMDRGLAEYENRVLARLG